MLKSSELATFYGTICRQNRRVFHELWQAGDRGRSSRQLCSMGMDILAEHGLISDELGYWVLTESGKGVYTRWLSQKGLSHGPYGAIGSPEETSPPPAPTGDGAPPQEKSPSQEETPQMGPEAPVWSPAKAAERLQESPEILKLLFILSRPPGREKLHLWWANTCGLSARRVMAINLLKLYLLGLVGEDFQINKSGYKILPRFRER